MLSLLLALSLYFSTQKRGHRAFEGLGSFAFSVCSQPHLEIPTRNEFLKSSTEVKED